MKCNLCGNESETDPCSRCESETQWAGSGRAAVSHEQRVHEMRYDLTEALTFLPEEYAQLPLFRLPGSAPSGDGIGRSHPGSRPPLNLVVMDLTDTREKPDCDLTRTLDEIRRDRTQWRWDDEDARRPQAQIVALTEPASRRQGIQPTLAQWVRLIDEDLDGTEGYESPWKRIGCCAACTAVSAIPTDEEGCCVGSLRPHAWVERTVEDECRYLLAHIDWIVEQPWASEIVKDAQRMRADVRNAIGERDPIGLDCLRCGNPVEKVVINGNEDTAYWRCTAAGCNTQWSRIELHKLELAQRPKTLAQIAPIIERSLRTLQDWAIRKPKRPPLIYPKGRDARGEKTYSLSEVRKVALMVPSERRRKTA